MNATMRAKLQIESVEPLNFGPDGEKSSEQLKLKAVCKSGGYPADGSDEDNSFAKWTPSAEMSMSINNPALFGKFEVGQKFYVDFTPAE